MSFAAAAPIVLAHEFGTAEWVWAVVAELFVLLWLGLLALAPRWSAAPWRAGRVRWIGLVAALLASGLTLLGKTLEVWPGHPLFPSGHTAWGVTIAVLLVALDRRWLPWVGGLLALLMVALVLANYHQPIDLLGGAGVGLPVGLGAVAMLDRTSRTAEQATRAAG